MADISSNISSSSNTLDSAKIVINDKASNPTTADTITKNPENELEEITKRINRIYEDKNIQKTIVLDELSIVTTQKSETLNENISDDHKAAKENVAGINYPLIKIMDTLYTLDRIIKMSIDVTGRIPEISLLLDNRINEDEKSKNLPKDGDIVSVFMGQKNQTIKPLRCDFVITTATPLNNGNLRIMGPMFIPGLTADKTFGYRGTSKDAFIDLAKKYGLGFATNDIDNTNDNQLWLCPNTTALSYANELISHTWKDETSFYDWWIDPYYNMVLLNVNKMVTENDSLIDVTAIESAYTADEMKDTEHDSATLKLFSNLTHTTTLNTFFILSYKLSNNSTEISINNGVEIKTKTFVHNQNLYNANKDNYQVLSNVPTYNPSKLDNSIILRGRNKYDKELNTDELAKANYSYKDIYIKTPYTGISYTVSDSDSENTDVNTWSGNVNKNYIRAEYHNDINMNEFNKIELTIVTQGLNLQTMRGELIPIAIAKDGKLDDNRHIDRFYSGQYYVKGIEYIFNKGFYNTKFTLSRREWPTPEKVESPNESAVTTEASQNIDNKTGSMLGNLTEY